MMEGNVSTQEEKAERAEAERVRRKQAKQKSKDRLRSEKEKAAAEREAKQKADLEEAQKAATASKARDELERCSADPSSCILCFTDLNLTESGVQDLLEESHREWCCRSILRCPMSSTCLVCILVYLNVVWNRSPMLYTLCVQEAQG